MKQILMTLVMLLTLAVSPVAAQERVSVAIAKGTVSFTVAVSKQVLDGAKKVWSGVKFVAKRI